MEPDNEICENECDNLQCLKQQSNASPISKLPNHDDKNCRKYQTIDRKNAVRKENTSAA